MDSNLFWLSFIENAPQTERQIQPLFRLLNCHVYRGYPGLRSFDLPEQVAHLSFQRPGIREPWFVIPAQAADIQTDGFPLCHSSAGCRHSYRWLPTLSFQRRLQTFIPMASHFVIPAQAADIHTDGFPLCHSSAGWNPGLLMTISYD
ncbi:MAG TPA: hypothetical protein PLG20_08425, partial [Candidatus Syntrophosphaera sp.]|nr:hypothetical protein [Candidatus Syntrophosphaera sp.]